MPAQNVSVAELAMARQGILNSFGDNDSEAVDLENMDRLYTVEASLEKAMFETDAHKLAGLIILLDLGDKPEFADSFKQKMFLRLQQFA
jgi:hypothetical protein